MQGANGICPWRCGTGAFLRHFFVVPAFTGSARGGSSHGARPDPLRGREIHAVVYLRIPKGWKAWCACAPSRETTGSSADIARAGARTQHGGVQPQNFREWAILLRKEAGGAGTTLWRSQCDCGWRSSRRYDFRGEAEEVGVVHWCDQHYVEQSPSSSAAKGSATGRSSRRADRSKGQGVRQDPTYFRALIRETDDGSLYLQHLTHRFDVEIETPADALRVLLGRSIEWEIVERRDSGRHRVRPYLPPHGKLARRLAAATDRSTARTD